MEDSSSSRAPECKRTSLTDSSSSASSTPSSKRRKVSSLDTVGGGIHQLPASASELFSCALFPVFPQKVKSLETETSACINGSFSREATPCSELCHGGEKDTVTKMEAQQLQAAANNRRRAVEPAAGRMMPPQAEMEEFFSAAEKYEQKRFTEKYNYDVVKDVPLQGRYQWVRLKP